MTLYFINISTISKVGFLTKAQKRFSSLKTTDNNKGIGSLSVGVKTAVKVYRKICFISEQSLN